MPVWNVDSRVSREVLFMRRSVMDGMRWAGTKMVCRQSFPLGSEHCPYCWDDILKQVKNTRCPHCNGTGYLEGYGEPFVLWCSILENSPVDEKVEKPGIRDEQTARLVLPCEPIFKDGDIFAEIREESDGTVVEVGRVFKLDGPVERQTVQGWVSDDHADGERRSVVEDIIIAQRGTAKLMLPTDSIYSAGAAFWNAESQIAEIPQGDQPTVEDGERIDPYRWWS